MTSQVPSCAVIVSAHNAGKTLSTTLTALRRQTLRGLQVRIVDDASTDYTPDLIADFAQKHSNVEWTRNHTLRGPGASRNYWLELVDTEYLGFLDADDWVHPDFYRALVTEAANVGAPFVKCGHTQCDQGERWIRYVPAPGFDRWHAAPTAFEPLNRTTMVDFPWSWSGIYRVDFFRAHGLRFDGDLHTAEDRVLTWRMHGSVDKFYVSSEYRYFYRRDQAASLTRIGDERQLDVFTAIERIFSDLEKAGAPLTRRAKAYRQAIALSEFHYNRRERLEPTVQAKLRTRIAAVLNGRDQEVVKLATQGFSRARTRLFLALRDAS